MEGELEYENFNAASAKVEIQGRNVHPGYAKNKMINAIDVACELQGLLPASQRPQFTEGYEGFYHCVGLNGTVENASVSYIIRDHDAEKFEQKKVFMWAAVDLLKKKYGDQVVTLTLKDQYYNMRKMVEPHPQVIDKALKAMETPRAAHSRRHGRRAPLVHGPAVPQPLHRRHEFPRQVRILLAHDDAQGPAGDPESGGSLV